jgi:hypothetical protein
VTCPRAPAPLLPERGRAWAFRTLRFGIVLLLAGALVAVPAVADQAPSYTEFKALVAEGRVATATLYPDDHVVEYSVRGRDGEVRGYSTAYPANTEAALDGFLRSNGVTPARPAEEGPPWFAIVTILAVGGVALLCLAAWRRARNPKAERPS